MPKRKVQFDKITERLRALCEREPKIPREVDPVVVAQKVAQGVFDGVTTSQLDNLAAETAAYMSTTQLGTWAF